MDDLTARRLRDASVEADCLLVERESQLAELLDLVDTTASQGALVLVAGEAGAGKSTLLEVLRDHARGTVTIRSGRCDPLTTPAPLGPLYEMRQSLPAEVTGPLERGQRELLFAAMLEELARTRNVLIVDDLHWADEATIDLLRYLGRRIRETRCLLVCAYRGDEIHPRHPLQPFLGELAVEATRIELPTLTLDGVVELAQGRDVDPLAVYAVTGGNPFFVSQMLLHPGSELPGSVEDAVLARARRLPDTAWEVLELVGIAPQGLPLDVVAELGATTGTDADAATALGLLVVDGERLRARHELIRRAFEASLAPTRRRQLHARLLAVLSGRSRTTVDTAALAHHALGAGDAAATIEHSLAAAADAARDGAHAEAAEHYANALRHEAQMDDATLQRVLEACAYERYLIGELEAAKATISRAIKGARTPTDRGRALRFLSRLRWFASDRDGALRAGREAVEVLEADGSDTHELGYAWSNLAQLAMLDTDWEAVQKWADKAIELARREGDAEVLAHALNNLGTAGRKAAGVGQLLEESLAISLEHELHEHAARAFTNLAYNEVWERELSTARQRLEEGLVYTEARDLDTWWTYMMGTRSELHLLTGDWDLAAADADLVLRTGDGLVMRHQASSVAARLALRRGTDAASSLVAQVLEDGLEIGEHLRLVTACALAVEHRWHTGERLWSAGQEAAVVDATIARGDGWGLAAIATWLVLLGEPCPDGVPAPVEAARNGRWDDAAAAWDERGCSFEASLLLAHAEDEEVRRDAVARLVALGALGTVRALRRRLPEHGIATVPRGPNRATRRNPAGLTRRQLEVLELLVRGTSNATIADELVISPKTVEHHVSAVLAKLGASSRGEAAALARERGLT